MGGKKSTISTSEQRIMSLQVQQSSYGLTLPVVFGQNRLAGNLIDYSDFTAIAHTTRTSAGKGGGGVTQEYTTYTYEAAVIMALCHGPINGVVSYWRDKTRRKDLEELELTLKKGEHDQPAWSWMEGKHPERALNYSGTAYLCSPNYSLGNNAQVPNHSFEVAGLHQVGDGNVDASPDDVLQDILTNPDWGASFPSTRLGPLEDYKNYCRASGIFVSIVLQEQQEAREHLRLLLEQTNSAPVWSGGTLKIIPYGDETITGSGATYTPDLQPVYDLTEDDFLVDEGEPPVEVEVLRAADRKNRVTIEYLDRENAYNIATASVQDQASIARDGYRPMEPIRMHGICRADVAHMVAQLTLQRSLYITREYRFRLGWRHCLLEPMDIVTITDEALGLDRYPVRIKEIEEDDSGELSFKAEDCPAGVGSAAARPGQPLLGGGVNFAAAPGDAFAPVIFEPPMQLTNNEPQLWIAAAGGPNWGGCNVWGSLDGDSYQNLGRLSGKSRYGTTTSALAEGPMIDSTQTLGVDLSLSGGQLLSGTQNDAESMVTACYVGGEYVSYANAALTGPGRYSLSYLVRGGYGSLNEAHPAGSKFVRLTDPLFRHSLPVDFIGKTLHIKLTSFNVFGGSEQSLADVPAYTYTVEGAPIGAVQGLRLVTLWALGREAKIAWEALQGASTYDVEVWAGSQKVRTAQGVVDNQYSYSAQDMMADGGPWRSLVFRVRGRAITGRAGQWSQIVAGNNQASALLSINVSQGINAGYVTVQTPPEDDVDGLIVWASTVPACPAEPENQVYDGPVGMVTISALADGTKPTPGTTYYVRAAAYDTFGKDELNVSTAVPFTPALVDIGPNTITETNIKDDSISTPKLRANSVTTDKVMANNILGQHIAAHQITGEHVQVGSLNANHFSSGVGSSNLLPNAGLIPTWSNGDGDQADGWTISSKPANTRVSISPDASVKPQNTEYMRFTFNSGAPAGLIVASSEPFPVAPDAWYEFQLKGVNRSSGVTLGPDGVATGGGRLSIALVFINAAGVTVPPKTVRGQRELPAGRGELSRDLNKWEQMFAMYQAPDTAVVAMVQIEVRTSVPTSSAQPNVFAFTRPYVGVATSSQQVTPTPWAPPGLGTQISGGMIKTNSIHADKIAVTNLSAIRANLGSVHSGDIYSSMVRGGGFNDWNWPTNIQGGFCLNSNGLRLGNRNQGRWFEVTAGGNLSAPGFNVTNGKLTIDELQVIRAANIKQNTVSAHYSISSIYANGTLTFITDAISTVVVQYGGRSNSNLDGQAFNLLYLAPSLTSFGIAHSTNWIGSSLDTGGGGASNWVHRSQVRGEFMAQIAPGTHSIRIPNPGFVDVLVVFR